MGIEFKNVPAAAPDLDGRNAHSVVMPDDYETDAQRWWLEGDHVFDAAGSSSRLAKNVGRDAQQERLQNVRSRHGGAVRRDGE